MLKHLNTLLMPRSVPFDLKIVVRLLYRFWYMRFFVSFRSFSNNSLSVLLENFSITLESTKISGVYRPRDCGRCCENGKGLCDELVYVPCLNEGSAEICKYNLSKQAPIMWETISRLLEPSDSTSSTTQLGIRFKNCALFWESW